MAVSLHGTTRLLLDGLPLNTIFECFSNMCEEIINVGQLLALYYVIKIFIYIR